jgi:hypothetical protein
VGKSGCDWKAFVQQAWVGLLLIAFGNGNSAIR